MRASPEWRREWRHWFYGGGSSSGALDGDHFMKKKKIAAALLSFAGIMGATASSPQPWSTFLISTVCFSVVFGLYFSVFQPRKS